MISFNAISIYRSDFFPPLLRCDNGTKDCVSQFIDVHGCDDDRDLEKQIRKKRNIHTATVQNRLESILNNPLIGRRAPDVNAAETLLPRVTKCTLAQLRAGKSPLLKEYLHRIGSIHLKLHTLVPNPSDLAFSLIISSKQRE